MNISPLLPGVDATAPTADPGAMSSAAAEQAKIADLSRQFETLLLRQILKDAQKTVIKSELTKESVSSDIYGDMITSQLAQSISGSGSFGFARALEKELTRQLVRPKPGANPLQST